MREAGEVTVQGGTGSLPPSVATMSTGQREGWGDMWSGLWSPPPDNLPVYQELSEIHHW